MYGRTTLPIYNELVELDELVKLTIAYGYTKQAKTAAVEVNTAP